MTRLAIVNQRHYKHNEGGIEIEEPVRERLSQPLTQLKQIIEVIECDLPLSPLPLKIKTF